MLAYGSDRVRAGQGETMIIASRLPKGWVPRVARTLTTAEFPGTAVLWEERYFEVLEERGVAGGVEYLLAPWPDYATMRVADRYDEGSEASRLAVYRAKIRQESNRKRINLLAIFFGHLPGDVQERIGSEYGIVASRLTLMSTLAVYAVVMLASFVMVTMTMRDHSVPLLLGFAIGLVALENTIRFGSVWLAGRPMGSLLGCFVYVVYSGGGDKPVAPRLVREEPPDEVKLHDAFVVREPLFTLLPAAEQARAAARFGYDYRRHSRITAAVIMVGSLIGIVSSFSRGAVVAMIVAVLLTAEQLVRLSVLRERPMGSVFGLLARPFVRKLL